MQVTNSNTSQWGADSTSTASNSTSSTGNLANENVFLQLLVAQIKNQNPLEPQDSSAFMGQLAQFSQLEQLTQINDQLTQLNTTATASASATDTYTGSDSKTTGN
ncbi:flagellar hook assembly protein FlgD [Paludibaculum fermentans]|uniref:Basal-body rod modification protein FlgD n=1 Tax=Paludibaculum fermentans TaxID=1473598 RepID=A0A7S7NTA5_PALFE|nr:flagellar hook capping FlgD N-terminal domain-containing protein [Paludibaculum fermentans]QOY88844.1 flagellar hook assembly protein FlgD [Paludibaculum fermentans]